MRNRVSPLVVLFALASAAALAQAPAPTPTTNVDLHPVADALLPYVVAAVGALITAVVGIAVKLLNGFSTRIEDKLNVKWGLEIDQAHATALNQALVAAAGGVIQRLGAEGSMSVKVSDPIIREFAQRTADAVPAAMKHMNLTPQDLAQRILNRIPQVLPVDGQAAPVPAAA
jgi:hypothetical protein